MEKIKKLFKLGGEVDSKTQKYIGIGGFFFILFSWYFITDLTGWVNPVTIPSPISVIGAFIELFCEIFTSKIEGSFFGLFEYSIPLPNFSEKNLLTNGLYSIGLNLLGYVKAISLAIPLGFIIALFPITKHMFSKYIDAMRYIPITGLIGVFIAWFGIGFEMKSNFLTLGVLVYLLPVVVQRVYETEKVHLDTVWTLGANSWQLFTKVYFPSVMSKVFVDIRVITAISWTYIIIAEMTNNVGGLGSMIYLAARQGRIEVIFAIILFIIFIGVRQDKTFQFGERKIFKHKFVKK